MNIRQLLSELKRQRRHLDQAIVALEALDNRKGGARRNSASRKLKAIEIPAKKTGTGGNLIPFWTARD